MSLCAIIPIKPLRQGKSRLSSVLSEEKREELNEFLLISTLNCVRNVPEIEKIIVISYDPYALSIARDLGAHTVLESRRTDINRALRKATAAAKAFNSTRLIIIPSDLPLITEDDIFSILETAGEPPEMVIVPDRKFRGTNALYIDPIGAIKYNFGDWSYKEHIEQAERKRIKIKKLVCENLSFDLDLPEDWDLLAQKINLISNMGNLTITEVSS